MLIYDPKGNEPVVRTSDGGDLGALLHWIRKTDQVYCLCESCSGGNVWVAIEHQNVVMSTHNTPCSNYHGKKVVYKQP